MTIGSRPDFESGWQAGTHVVTVEDEETAYSLHRRERRVARFGHNRLMPRFGAEQLLLLVGLP